MDSWPGTQGTFTSFAGQRQVATGDIKDVILAIKAVLDAGETETVLVFDDQTGDQVDFDLRGTPQEALVRLGAHPMFSSVQTQFGLRPGPGRPKLGVVCREVSLLPRHWDWLDQHSGGVSSTLRRLIDEAKKRGQGKELARAARNAAGKFMWAMAGNFPNFEEASRALFARDDKTLRKLIRAWPADIRKHVERSIGEAADLEKQAAQAAEVHAKANET
ncbi:MAG: DUF2239 family protein [Deltaproteobacteria bacterium]|nr:DUF2239 family protein [Deltaproteobacteria bacterium]